MLLCGLFTAVALLFSACTVRIGDTGSEGTNGNGQDTQSANAGANPETGSATDNGADGNSGGQTGGNRSAPNSNDNGNSSTPSGAPPYEDPRGQRFVEFQRGFDRSHPFGSLNAFCEPHELPAEPLRATDSGISAEEINFVHLRTRIEELAFLGFAEDVGDVQEIFETFTTLVNENCGGVRGRRINLAEVEISAISATVGQDVENFRNAACIEATETLQGVILLNTTSFQGTGVLCVVEEHDAALIGSLPFPEEYMRRGGGKLVSLSASEDSYLRELARYLIRAGELDDSKVAVIAPNTPGQEEAVRTSLLNELRAGGVDVAVFEIIDCAGGNICLSGVSDAVQRMISEGVDTVFPTLNAISLPSFVSEMHAQGFRLGDIRFFNSDFNSQGNELVASKVADFGGDAAGKLYNGTLMLVSGDGGSFRKPEFTPAPFDEMCMRTFRLNAPKEIAINEYDPYDSQGHHKYVMVVMVCSIMRMALRAVYDAGVNPTRADIFAALERLGAVDAPSMLPATITPEKWSAADVFQATTFQFPCEVDGSGRGAAQSCLNPESGTGWIWPER